MTTLAAPLPSVRSDTLPEHISYRDDGCDVSMTCLECPLAVCKYDDPGWVQRQDRRTRDSEILNMRARGMTVPEIAVRFRISSRTVHRVLERGAPSKADVGSADEGPLMTLQELARRSLFRARTPWPRFVPSSPMIRN